MTDWISVEERLPAQSGNYLICFRCRGSDAEEVYVSSTFCYAEGESPRWDAQVIRDDIKITHWMPLPEPPEVNK